MAAKSSDWQPGPTVCRCCLTEGCYKDISTEYFWMGKREVYSEMLSETFDVTISYALSMGTNSNSRLICEPCISRLRDASDFKRQVLDCERTFLQYLVPQSSSAGEGTTATDQDIKVSSVKLEVKFSDDEEIDTSAPFQDDDDDLDDEPLTKLASKIPKKESVDYLELEDNAKPVKRKSTIKIKASPSKKAKKTKETVKATASKAAATAKPEKKKKESVAVKPKSSSHHMAKMNAQIILRCATVYPFRLQRKSLLCVFCRDQFDDPDEFRSHMAENHQKFSLFTAFAHCNKGQHHLKVDCSNITCKICNTSFENLENVARHLQSDHDCKKLNLNYEIGLQPYRLSKDRYDCYHCDRKFESLTNLCRHTTSHYQKYSCDTCGRTYMTNGALAYHIKCSHSGTIVCRRCWKVFPSEEKKSEHIRESERCRPFCCNICQQRFNSWEMKQKHLVEEHKQQQVTYDCPTCNESFQDRKLFHRHFKIHHTDDSFICTCCGLKFDSKHRLEDHKIGHTGVKLHSCSICDKSFSRKKNLKQHLWIHSETKRFACPLCNKQFVQKVSLQGHMKSHLPVIEISQ